MTTNYVTAQGVQQFSITIANGNTTGTTTINAVGSGAVVLWDGFNPSVANDPAQDFAYLTLTNATTITATRNSGAAGTVVMNGCVIDGDTTNLIKSVQYGTATVAAGSSSGTATISAVTNSNAGVHLLGWSSGNATYSGIQENPTVSLSGTTVTAAVANGAGGSGLVVGFVAVEFQGSALNSSTQQFSATSSSSVTSYTKTITSVNTNNAICLYGGSQIATSTTNFAQIKQYGTLTNGTTFTVNVNTAVANAKTYNGTIIEFAAGVLNSSVQRGTTTLVGATTNSVALGAINPTYSGLGWLGNSTTSTAAQANRAEGAGALGSTYDYIIQSPNTSGASGSSYSISLSATQAGSLIVVPVSGTAASVTVTGITDNKGQIYSQVSGARATDSTSNFFTDIWYFPNSASGVTSITVSLSGGTAAGYATGIEVANMATSSPVDGSAAASNIASTNKPQSGNITTTAGNDLIVVVLSGNTGANSIASPYNLVNPAGIEGYTVASTPVTNQNVKFTLGGATTTCISSAAFLSANVQTQFVTVTKNNANNNVTGSWEAFEFPAFSGGTIVFADCPALLEYLATIRRDGLGPLEYIASLRRDGPLPLEYAGSLRADAKEPFEFLASASGDSPDALEWLAGARDDSPIPLENTCSLTRDAASPIEWGAGAARDGRLPGEYALSVKADGPLIVEMLAGGRADHPLPVEWTGAISITLDSSSPLEWLSATASDSPAPAEWLAGLRADSPESIERLSGFLRETPLHLEYTGAASADSRTEVEHLVGARRDDPSPIEWLGSTVVIANSPMPIEWVSGTARDNPLVAEYLASLSADAETPADRLGSVPVNMTMPAEYLSSVVSAAGLPSERLSSVVSDGILPAEWQVAMTAVLADSSLPLEWVSSVVRDADARAEWTAVMDAAARLLLEWSSTPAPTPSGRTFLVGEASREFAASERGRRLTASSTIRVIAATGPTRIFVVPKNPRNFEG